MGEQIRMGAVLQSERARVAHASLKAEALAVLAEARGVVAAVRGAGMGPEVQLALEIELARHTWDLSRDALLAALEVDREEQRLRADVAATGALLAKEMGDE